MHRRTPTLPHALLGCLGFAALLSTPAGAEVGVEDAHRGYWNSQAGAYCPNIPFSGAGSAGGTCRSAFVFDLSRPELDFPVGSAVLWLEILYYWSSVESECFSVYEVLTDPARIV